MICINLDRCVPIYLSPLFSSMVHRRCCLGSLFSLSTFMPWPHRLTCLAACLIMPCNNHHHHGINTLALQCTAFHMTPFIGMHGWVHVCKCLLCPDGWKKLNRFVSPCLDLGQADLPPSRMLAVAMLQLIHHLCHLAQNPVAAEFPTAGPETAIDSSFTHCLLELPLL